MTRIARISLGVMALLCARGAFAQMDGITRFRSSRHLADVARALPYVFLSTRGFLTPSSKGGAFALTGNPATLAWDVSSSRTDYVVAQHTESGDYRRPLDATRSEVRSLALSGRTPTSSVGGVIGSIVLENEHLSPGPRVDQSEPHGTSPLVLVDTAASPMRSMGVAISGAGGWRIGGWAVGGSAFYDTRNLRTQDAGFVRQTRVVTPDVTLGVGRELGTPMQLVVGAHAGVRRIAETTEFFENGAEGRLYQLQGFRDVPPIDVVQFYYQRLEQRTRYLGAHVSGTAIGSNWTIGGESARRRDATWHAEQRDPLVDRWSGDGEAIYGALLRPFGESMLRIQGRSARARGALRMSTDSTAALTARDQQTTVEAELRTPLSARAAAEFVLGLRDARLNRRDTSLGVRVQLTSRAPIIAMMFSYSASARATALFGIGQSWHRAAGVVPRFSEQGVAYQRYVAPEIALYASPASSTSAHLGGRWLVNRTTILTLVAGRASVSPTGFRLLAERPSGNRINHFVALTVSSVPTGSTE